MAGLNQQARVGAEEGFIHGDNLTIRQYPVGMVFQGFDVAEDVIPAAAVQAHNMVTQRMEDLMHLEYGWQGFNQQRGLNGAARQAEAVFCVAEDFTPPRRFLPGLGFRQIEIGAAAFRQQVLMVVEEVQRKVEQAARNRFSAPRNVFFWQMQTAYAADQHRRIRFELVNFTGFVGIADGAVDGVAQVDLPVDNFLPVRREGIFEVRHKYFDVGIHGVNHHFALYRAGDLYATIL